jgi:hypothetical protein
MRFVGTTLFVNRQRRRDPLTLLIRIGPDGRVVQEELSY